MTADIPDFPASDEPLDLDSRYGTPPFPHSGEPGAFTRTLQGERPRFIAGAHVSCTDPTCHGCLPYERVYAERVDPLTPYEKVPHHGLDYEGDHAWSEWGPSYRAINHDSASRRYGLPPGDDSSPFPWWQERRCQCGNRDFRQITPPTDSGVDNT